MQQSTDLKTLLQSVHRKSYPAYKSLKGSYQFASYILSIDHVQGDPFASPSHISIRIPLKTAGFPTEYLKDHITRVTLSDYLTRQFEKQICHYTFRAKGSGKSGLISVSHCGQEVLERTACEITEKGITARFFIGFPANGRTINATELEKILFDFLPVCVQKAFLYGNIDHRELEQTTTKFQVAAGVSRRWIYISIFRRSLSSVVVVFGLIFGGLIGGAVTVESMFGFGGLGALALRSVSAVDFPTLQGFLIISVAFCMFAFFLVDLVNMWLDPRRRPGVMDQENR